MSGLPSHRSRRALEVIVLPILDGSCLNGASFSAVAKSVMRWVNVCVFSLNCHVNCCLMVRRLWVFLMLRAATFVPVWFLSIMLVCNDMPSSVSV